MMFFHKLPIKAQQALARHHENIWWRFFPTKIGIFNETDRVFVPYGGDIPLAASYIASLENPSVDISPVLKYEQQLQEHIYMFTKFSTLDRGLTLNWRGEIHYQNDLLGFLPWMGYNHSFVIQVP